MHLKMRKNLINNHIHIYLCLRFRLVKSTPTFLRHFAISNPPSAISFSTGWVRRIPHSSNVSRIAHILWGSKELWKEWRYVLLLFFWKKKSVLDTKASSPYLEWLWCTSFDRTTHSLCLSASSTAPPFLITAYEYKPDSAEGPTSNNYLTKKSLWKATHLEKREHRGKYPSQNAATSKLYNLLCHRLQKLHVRPTLS